MAWNQLVLTSGLLWIEHFMLHAEHGYSIIYMNTDQNTEPVIKEMTFIG